MHNWTTTEQLNLFFHFPTRPGLFRFHDYSAEFSAWFRLAWPSHTRMQGGIASLLLRRQSSWCTFLYPFYITRYSIIRAMDTVFRRVRYLMWTFSPPSPHVCLCSSKLDKSTSGSMALLKSRGILITPIHTDIWNCHAYPVQKRESWFLKEIYGIFSSSVLVVGNSTSGEHGVTCMATYPQ